MKFNICSIEPNEYKYCFFWYDIIRLYQYTLESLGHQCNITQMFLDKDCINIIFGSHLIKDMDAANTIMGYEYIIIHSEVAKGPFPIHEAQITLMKNAKAVWTGIPDNVEGLAALGITASVLHLGYHEKMEDIRHKEKDIDFLFYGSITPHRKEMLTALVNAGGKVMTIFDTPLIYRNDLIARTKIFPIPHNGPGQDHFGSARALYLINNKCLPIVEQSRDGKLYKDCCIWTSSDQFVHTCCTALQRYNEYNTSWPTQVNCFKSYKKLPMTNFMQPLLEDLK